MHRTVHSERLDMTNKSNDSIISQDEHSTQGSQPGEPRGEPVTDMEMSYCSVSLGPVAVRRS
jgi:hypothetical protein